MKQLDNDVFEVIQYFGLFNYPPTFEEIYTFFKKKSSKRRLAEILTKMEKGKNLIRQNSEKIIIENCKLKIVNYPKYTLPQYSKIIKNQRSKTKNSKKKLESWRFRLYIKFLSLFPQIKLVGLSGSIAMMNAKKEDDIDLFIICAKNRLFTGRFITLVFAQMLGLRRSFRINQKKSTDIGLYQKSDRSDKSDVSDKVCLNLFFEEKVLSVPKFKQTAYVAHEILQMKPLVKKNYTYEKFLFANRWVLSFFPNAAKISKFKILISNQFQILKFKNYKLNKNFKLKIKNLGDWIESRLKRFQLRLINKHQTTEIITDSQLWFHPDDFDKKIRRLTRI